MILKRIFDLLCTQMMDGHRWTAPCHNVSSKDVRIKCDDDAHNARTNVTHDDVLTFKLFPHYWLFFFKGNLSEITGNWAIQPYVQINNKDVEAPHHWPFESGIHWSPVNSPHMPMIWEIFLCHEVFTGIHAHV